MKFDTVLILTAIITLYFIFLESLFFKAAPKCRVWKVKNILYKNCFYGTEKTRTSTSTSTSTVTSTSTSTKTSTSSSTSTSTSTKTSTSTVTSTSTSTITSTTTVSTYATFPSSLNSNIVAYWSFNGVITDTTTGGSLTVGSSLGTATYSWVADRYGKANKAVYLNSANFLMPSKTYFYGDFTITAWINPQAVQNWARIIDCWGSGSLVCFGMCYGTSQNLQVQSNGVVFQATYSWPLNSWFHAALSVVSSTGTATVYQNGTADGTTTSFGAVTNTLRSSCYIGKSHAGTQDLDPISYFDDVYIFNIALSQSQVMSVMNAYN